MYELTIVMPCLNEADTIESCIRKAQAALAKASIDGEILIADNGSTDGCPGIASRLGARVIHVKEKGYGSALMAGITAANSEFVLMGDADDSYDFGEAPNFLAKLREGHDLVQGCRLPSGGGVVLPNAMPLLHRWVGNPLLTALVRTWFHAPIHDVYCGMRAFSKDLYQRLDQRCTGMEFATEMIVKASLFKADISEVPITLHPDGRKAHPPHLKTFRDGWRTLRLLLMYSPRWLFLLPGLLLIILGIIGYGIALPGLQIGKFTFDAHTLLFASLAIMCGYQSCLFAVLSKTFAVNERLMPAGKLYASFYKLANLERGIVAGLFLLLIGLLLLVLSIYQWYLAGWGRLNYSDTMRLVIPGATSVVLGFQTILFGFFLSILGLRHK